MTRTQIGSMTCLIHATANPEAVIIQLTARHEAKTLDSEVALIEQDSACGWVFAAIELDNWALGLMPWADEAVSRHEEVGTHAVHTLSYIETELLPWLRERFGTLPVIIGGYSLGGLFALWAASHTDSFTGVAAASPSVWIRGWDDFAESHPIKARMVYTSLGDREELARNRRMAAVGDCMRRQHRRLANQIGEENTLHQWNEGGHFDNEDRRMAQAFIWNLRVYRVHNHR